MEMSSQVQQFWAQFVVTAGADAADDVAARFYEAFHFDDNEVDANALIDLVLQGRKRATASLLWGYEGSHKPLPKVGDLYTIVDHKITSLIRKADSRQLLQQLGVA